MLKRTLDSSYLLKSEIKYSTLANSVFVSYRQGRVKGLSPSLVRVFSIRKVHVFYCSTMAILSWTSVSMLWVVSCMRRKGPLTSRS